MGAMILCVSLKSDPIGGYRESLFFLTASLFSKPIQSFRAIEKAKVHSPQKP
jgi:hypothetical protein